MYSFIGVYFFQAFINTAKEIYQKIQDGVFDVTNEVCVTGGNFRWVQIFAIFADIPASSKIKPVKK